mgnify:CR=1 FL=1
MLQYAEECRTIGVPFIWDPGQQCARMSGDELASGLAGAAIVICTCGPMPSESAIKGAVAMIGIACRPTAKL